MAKNDMKEGLNVVLTKINKFLELTDMKRGELADKAGMDVNNINKWFSKNCVPDFSSIFKVVTQGFEISLASFFAEDDEPWELDENEKALIRTFQKLSKEQREKLIKFIQSLQ